MAILNESMGIPGDSVVKNLPTVQETQETWVRSLGWEDPLEEEMITHSNILAMDRGVWWATLHGVASRQELVTTERLSTH